MENLESRNGQNETISEKEILQGLSPAFYKTVQEVLPGLLPDKAPAELTAEEKSLYVETHDKLEKLMEAGHVEATLREENPGEMVPEATKKQRARAQFRLKTDKGKAERGDEEIGGTKEAPASI